MNVTFGICTEYEDKNRLQLMVASIDALHIPYYEIILVGGDLWKNPHIYSNGYLRQLPSTEWLPGKKNLIAKEAHFDVLCLAHDYFLFDPYWYDAYLNFGKDWDVCSNPQLLITGKRHFTDWVNWDHPDFPRYFSFNYDDWSKTRFQYISGQYFLVKRNFLRENPMNELLRPGAPEDVDWSFNIRHKAKIKCNPHAIVRHTKVHRDVGNTSFPLYQHVRQN